MNIIVKTVLLAGAIMVTDFFMGSVEVNSLWSAIILAIVLTGLNKLVKPILVVLTIPITLVTLGLFLLVINALLGMLADYLLGGFVVAGFWSALFFSIILSVVMSILQALSGVDKDGNPTGKRTQHMNARSRNDHFDDYEEVK